MTTYEEVVACPLTGGNTHVWKFNRADTKELEQLNGLSYGAIFGRCQCGGRTVMVRPLGHSMPLDVAPRGFQ